MSVLRANNLRKHYKGRKVIHDVSLEVKSGEVVGLLGPNGAGKTTCFYMIVGLIRPDDGTLMLNEIDVSNAPMHERAQQGIGYLPQEASIFKKLTVEENILAILETRKDLDLEARYHKLETLLAELHITDRRHILGISLSGGERRRAEIARALATEPDFILLDEPFAGVDPISVIEIQSLITHLKQRGIGVLITDHSVRETLRICDHAYILSEGTILCAGTPKHVLANEDVKRVYLGADFSL